MEQTKKKMDANRVLTVAVAVLSLVLVGLLIWGAVLLAGQKSSQEATPSDSQQTQTQSQSQSVHTKPDPSKPEQTQPTETKPAQTKPTESQPAPTKPTEPRPTETKPTQPTKPTEPVPDDPEVPEKDPTIIAAEEKITAFAEANGFTLADYPQKLIELLARKPETEEYVCRYPLEYGKDHPIDISGHAADEGVPLFIQWDKQWGYLDYTGNVFGLAGCGPTCMSMIMYHFTRDAKYTPAYMLKFAESNSSYAVKGYGTQWAFFKQGGKELGLDVKELTSEQIKSESKIANVLDSGRIIVMNVSPGVFTTVGHYLLVVGYEDGKFRVNDPNSEINSEKLWEFEEFSDQIRMMWSFKM
ncbi:MAG: hypothetical protein E7466_01930 [Ruminococcaceae bacterium]|nr:hypothetical protein [Oscillospiraceae bacterium]MBQ3215735.1 C39 family peptidase [Oscillospiraceae bacterium]